jgi:hypothetical protein
MSLFKPLDKQPKAKAKKAPRASAKKTPRKKTRSGKFKVGDAVSFEIPSTTFSLPKEGTGEIVGFGTGEVVGDGNRLTITDAVEVQVNGGLVNLFHPMHLSPITADKQPKAKAKKAPRASAKKAPRKKAPKAKDTTPAKDSPEMIVRKLRAGRLPMFRGGDGVASSSLPAYFVNDPEWAKHYGPVREYEIQLKNPQVIDNEEWRNFDSTVLRFNPDPAVMLRVRGFDSVVNIRDLPKGGQMVLVYALEGWKGKVKPQKLAKGSQAPTEHFDVVLIDDDGAFKDRRMTAKQLYAEHTKLEKKILTSAKAILKGAIDSQNAKRVSAPMIRQVMDELPLRRNSGWDRLETLRAHMHKNKLSTSRWVAPMRAELHDFGKEYIASLKQKRTKKPPQVKERLKWSPKTGPVPKATKPIIVSRVEDLRIGDAVLRTVTLGGKSTYEIVTDAIPGEGGMVRLCFRKAGADDLERARRRDPKKSDRAGPDVTMQELRCVDSVDIGPKESLRIRKQQSLGLGLEDAPTVGQIVKALSSKPKLGASSRAPTPTPDFRDPRAVIQEGTFAPTIEIKYGPGLGVLICGETYYNRAAIKRAYGGRMRFSRNLPEGCAWYVPRSRNWSQADKEKAAQRIADDLAEALKGRQVTVNITRQGVETRAASQSLGGPGLGEPMRLDDIPLELANDGNRAVKPMFELNQKQLKKIRETFGDLRTIFAIGIAYAAKTDTNGRYIGPMASAGRKGSLTMAVRQDAYGPGERPNFDPKKATEYVELLSDLAPKDEPRIDSLSLGRGHLLDVGFKTVAIDQYGQDYDSTYLSGGKVAEKTFAAIAANDAKRPLYVPTLKKLVLRQKTKWSAILILEAAAQYAAGRPKPIKIDFRTYSAMD